MITARLEGEKAVSQTLKNLISGMKNSRGFFKVWAHKTTLMAKASARGRSKGGRFWPSIARQTRVASADDSGAVIRCYHFAGAQKEFGGIISAKGAGALTIPISPAAKGKRAGEFQETFVAKGVIFRKKGKKGVEPLFVLKKSVSQRPEPWWPKAAPVLAEGEKLAAAHIDREMRK